MRDLRQNSLKEWLDTRVVPKTDDSRTRSSPKQG